MQGDDQKGLHLTQTPSGVQEIRPADRQQAEQDIGTPLIESLYLESQQGIDVAILGGARLMLEFGPLPAFEALRLVQVEAEGRRHVVNSIEGRKPHQVVAQLGAPGACAWRGATARRAARLRQPCHVASRQSVALVAYLSRGIQAAISS